MSNQPTKAIANQYGPPTKSLPVRLTYSTLRGTDVTLATRHGRNHYTECNKTGQST